MRVFLLASVVVSLVFGTMLFSVAPVQAAVTPGRVSDLEWVAKKAKRVELRWKLQPDAQYYQVRVMKGGEVVQKRRTNTNSKIVKGLQPNTSYTFRVRARSGSCDDCAGKYSWPIKTRTKITIASETGDAVPLFGFWGLNGYISPDGLADVRSRFNTTVFQVASSAPNYTVNTLLPLVRASGMHVTLRMTDDHNAYTTNGNFDLEKWKAQIAVWKDSGVQEFIDDGTLVGHMLLDDIDTFAGENPTASELDQMARYSKYIMPGLLTYVRQSATEMPIPSNRRHAYKYLDAVDSQYVSWDGDAARYAQTEHDAARALHLGVINGLNIADGGDGSSSQPGWREGKYAMSAAEITAYGNAMLGVPHVQMLLLWEYDGEELWSDGSVGADYFDQIDVQSALADVGAQAAEYAQ